MNNRSLTQGSRTIVSPTPEFGSAASLGDGRGESGSHGDNLGSEQGSENQRYTEPASLLGERMLTYQGATLTNAFAEQPLDKHLFLKSHRYISGDLLSEWAGLWSAVEVQVGNLSPPPLHQVPQLLSDHSDNLAASWREVFPVAGPLALETLSIAKVLLLTIHPFLEVQGSVTRLWPHKILHRTRLPKFE